LEIQWTLVTSELVLGDKSCFLERIPLFLEFGRFLDTPAIARSSVHLRSNVAPLVFDSSKGLKLLALEFKCDRLLTKSSISPDGDYAPTQHENVIDLLIQLSDLPLSDTEESSESYKRHCLMV
jgi:hypothetical protein